MNDTNRNILHQNIGICNPKRVRVNLLNFQQNKRNSSNFFVGFLEDFLKEI